MKLGLGTVQFGTNYGVSNPGGKTPLEEVKAILKVAQENEIDVIDTACSYGESESVLGAALQDQHKFRIITKTPVFKKKKITNIDAETLKTAFHGSLDKLKQSKVTGLLIHNADDLFVDGGEILFSTMGELKEEGLVEKIGASVYTGEQIDRLLERYEIDLIQLPMNVLDQRLINGDHLARLKRRCTEIHARSVFLQGLLLMDVEQIPEFFDPITPVLHKYRKFLDSYASSPVEGALGFVKSISEIDCIIVGVNNQEQFKANLKGFIMSSKISNCNNFKDFFIKENKYLNPGLWKIQ